ncbi:MAG: hypothetical protein ACT4ON_02735 [Bacteroidota bacterium]
MSKNFFIPIIFFVFCFTLNAQDNRGTIRIKKDPGMTLKACICGKTDTIFISKKKLFNDSTTIDICNGRKLIPNKVLNFTVRFLDKPRVWRFSKNKFEFYPAAKQHFLDEVNNMPPLTTLIVTNILFATKHGESEMHSSGNLIIVLTD